MPTTPSATTTVNGSAVTDAVAVAASSTVTLALASTFGVRSVTYTIVGNSSSALTNPTITLGADYTATFTMPSGSNQGYLIETKINNGRDELGRFATGYKFRFVVGVVGGSGFVPICLGERTERGTYGWLDELNGAVASGLSAVSLLTADGGELTIATDAVTVSSSSGRHTIDTEADAAFDYLSNISGGYAGQVVVLSPANSARHVIVTNTGNIQLRGSRFFVLANANITLQKQGSSWVEISREIFTNRHTSAATSLSLLLEYCTSTEGVYMTNSSASTFTIETDATTAYPTGAMIPITRTDAAVTLTAASGVTINGGTSYEIPSYSTIVLWKTSGNTWRINGVDNPLGVNRTANGGNARNTLAPNATAHVDAQVVGSTNYDITLPEDGYYIFSVLVFVQLATALTYRRVGATIDGSRASGTLTVEGSQAAINGGDGTGLTLTLSATSGNLRCALNNATGEAINGHINVYWGLTDLPS